MMKKARIKVNVNSFSSLVSLVSSDENDLLRLLTENALDSNDDTSICTKIKRTIFKRFHILQWLPRYSRGDIVADFIAGLTVGMTMIPQSVAYAGLAGLKPQYGLYTAFIGSFTYVFVGTVKEVSIGPTSLMALLTFSYVVGRPIECVILLTFLAGCIELAMGLFKLGFLVDFISPCLTNGFTSATSVIIIVSQLKGFLGIQVKNHSTFPAIKEISGKLGDIRFADTFLGVLCIAFLLSFKLLTKIKTKSPGTKKVLWFLSISKNALVVFISTLIASIWYNCSGSTPFKLTGTVPSGLPEIGLPPIHAEFNNGTMTLVDMVTSLGSGLIVVPIVAVLANVAIAKAYTYLWNAMHSLTRAESIVFGLGYMTKLQIASYVQLPLMRAEKYHFAHLLGSETVVDASQEMISLGLCNIFGSFVRAMPSCGAFTRSSVASSSGVRTPLQGIYSGAVIILALSFLAPYFFYIPKATLAAVLIVAASTLVDYEIFITLWKCNKIDFLMTVMTLVVGVVVSVEMSLVLGAILNAMILLKPWSRPRITIEIKSLEKGLDYLYVKPELGLFYPAADYLTESIKKAHRKCPSTPIALDCSRIMQVDYSASKSIEAIAKTYHKKQVGVVFLNVNEKVLKTLKTILDETSMSLCQRTDQVSVQSFAIRENRDEEGPLIIRGLDERRYSEKREDIRKGSLCDLE